jgi:type IV secretory pathway VirB10-like protein
MELEREPNPQPAPLPQGAVAKDAKVKALAVVVGLFLFVLICAWLLWPRHIKGSVMGPNRVAGKAQIQPKEATSFDISMEKEKAYEEGKRDASNSFLGQLNSQNRQAQQTPAPAPYYAPVSHTQQIETAPTRSDFADNMVTDGSFNKPGRDVPADAGRPDNNVGPAIGPISDSPGNRVSPVAEISQNILPEGTLVYTALINELNGDNTGPFKVQVSNDVYFPGTRTVAIPQGSVLIGEAQKVGAQFQQRLAVSFHSLQVGNKQIKLDKMPGLDQQGASAVKDQVNNHYAQIFGASLAIGAIGGLAQIGNGNYGGAGGYDTGTQVRNGISQSTAQSASQILNHFLQRMPTITIRPGTPVVVFLTGNVEIPNA